MSTSTSLRWLVAAASAALLLAFAVACSEAAPAPAPETIVVEKEVVKEVMVPGETVVVEKEVVRTVEVPGETVVQEVVKEVMVPGETVVVEKVVTETVEVPGKTVVQEVVKEVMVPGETVIVEKEVIKTVEVPGETVVVEREVIKTVEVPGETVVVKEEVIKTIEVPVEIVKTVVKEIPGQAYVTDPTNGVTYVAPQYGGTLTFANRRNPPNADQTVGGLGAGYAVSGVLQKLGYANWGIDRSVRDLKNEFLNVSDYVGALAESWAMPDPTTIVFNIRPGVNWHDKAPMNGRELTASDVAFSFHRLRGEGSGFTEPPPQTSYIRSLAIESITAPDDATVVFKLEKVQLSAMLSFIDDSYAYIYPPEVIQQYGDTTDWKNLVGTGPFELVEWVEGDSMTFEKNENYWGYDEKYPAKKLPYIDRLRGLLMPDPAVRIAALRAGRIDFLGHNASSQIRTVDEGLSLLKTNPELNANAYYFRANNAYGFRVNEEPFSDIRVRRAMQMALDLPTINKEYFRDLAVITPQGPMGDFQTGFVVPFEQWPEEIKGYYTYDPEGAMALLDEAGLTPGSNGVRFSTELDVVVTGYDGGLAEIAKEYWKQIGVEVEIKQWDGATKNSRWQEGIAKGMTNFISASPYEPSNALSWLSNGPWNVTGHSEPEYDALFQSILDAETLEEQMRLSREGNMYSVTNHLYVWTALSPWFNFTQPYVAGFNGDFFMGRWQKNSVFARLWIDQALKSQLGR